MNNPAQEVSIEDFCGGKEGVIHFKKDEMRKSGFLTDFEEGGLSKENINEELMILEKKCSGDALLKKILVASPGKRPGLSGSGGGVLEQVTSNEIHRPSPMNSPKKPVDKKKWLRRI